MEEDKILNHISSCEGYEYALITTFNLDIGFFERFVVNSMYEKGLRKIALFVDANELVNALKEVDNCAIGRKYFVCPVEMNGAFHPKLILLLGQDRARLIIASANLTSSGYFRNSEIFNVFEFNANHPETLSLISDAISFFEAINKLSFQHDEDVFDDIKKLSYYGKTAHNEERRLIHNLDKPILDQLAEIVRDVKKIDIAAPFYDNELSAVRALSEQNPDAGITLYVQNRKSRFPIFHQSSPYISELRAYDSANKRSAFYHGKVLRFETSESSFVLYGSANCTQSALMKSFPQGGNIECSVLERGAAGEFNSFFDSFDFTSKDLQCDPITYLAVGDQNIVFRYGVLDKTLRLFFGVKAHRDYEAYLGDNKLSASCDSGAIIVDIDPPALEDLPSVFEISFRFCDDIELVRCWYPDRMSLLINRSREVRDIVYEIDFDNNEDRYLQDKETILRELPITPDELKGELAVRRSVRGQESDSDEDDGGIVSFEIPPAETVQRFQRIERLHDICHRYISSYYTSVLKGTSAKKAHSTDATADRPIYRSATNYELLFQKFVSRRIRDLTAVPFLPEAEYNRYLSYILVFEDIFKKYSVEEKVQAEEKRDLFPFDFVANSEAKMCQRLLEKVERDKPELSIQERETTIVVTLHAILSLWETDNDLHVDSRLISQRLIRSLDSIFAIRSSYLEYAMLAVDEINLCPSHKINHGAAITHLDSLFGYLTEERLRSVIQTDYGKQANISIDVANKDVFVRTTVQEIGQHMRIKPKTLKELDGFCRHWGIPKFQIVIENEKGEEAYRSKGATRFVVYDAICEQKTLVQTLRSYDGKERKTQVKYSEALAQDD